MLRGETKRLPVGSFRLDKPTFALVKTILFQPAVDSGPVALFTRGFLTACSARFMMPRQPDRSVAESVRPVKGPAKPLFLPA